jgi:LysR family transcriptional regulator, low CO2-responsive transcriptional regulator
VIMGRPPRELATVAVPFAKHPLVIIAAPNHPLANKRRVPLKQLANENFVIREEGSGTRAAMGHVFKAHGAAYRTSMEVTSNETIKQAVMAGLGVAFISIYAVRGEVATKRLHAVRLRGIRVQRHFHVIHHEARRIGASARAFMEILAQAGRRRVVRPGRS